MEFPHAFFQGLQRGGSVQIHLLPVHVLPPEVIWKLYMNITKLLLLNPAENPKLIPTFFMLALRVVSVALWWSGSGLEVTLSPSAGCLQVLNLWGLGWVIFSFSCYCFSLITTKTSLWQDFLLPIFLVLSFVSTVSPVKTATWWNDVKNQSHSCIYCTRASLKQVQIARLFYLKRTIYLQEIKTLLLQLLAVAFQTLSL